MKKILNILGLAMKGKILLFGIAAILLVLGMTEKKTWAEMGGVAREIPAAKLELESADLGVTVSGCFKKTESEKGVYFNIVVTNYGPEISTGAKLVINSTSFFSSTSPSQGTCKVDDYGLVVCDFGSIPKDGTVKINLFDDLTGDGYIIQFIVQAFISTRFSRDPNLSNNSAAADVAELGPECQPIQYQPLPQIRLPDFWK